MKKTIRYLLLLSTVVYCTLFLSTNTPAIMAASSVEVVVSNQDYKTGTATILVKNVPQHATKVSVPIWSNANGQDDIIWYTAKPTSNSSTYKVEFDSKNHAFQAGAYSIHAYTADANGRSTFATATTMKYEVAKPSQAVLSVSSDAGIYRVQTLAPITTTGCKSVQYAVWSTAHGQDDIRWYNGTYDKATHNWYADINTKYHKSTGTYMIHTYVRSTNNQRRLYASSTLQLSSTTSIGTVTPTFDSKSGDFKITISNVKCPAGISQLRVPIWSTGNQDNIVWYTANRTKEGTYVVESNISKHKNTTGNYHIHIYAKNNFGQSKFITSSSLKMTALPSVVTARDTNKKQTTMELKLANHKASPNSNYISFAVWSDQKGKDDLIWYKGTKKDMLTTIASVKIANHKTAGTYHVHAYEYFKNGRPQFLDATTFHITQPSTSKVKYTTSKVNTSTGTFDVTISNINAPAGIQSVRIPVWSASNQSDIHWYTATRVNSTTFKTTVNAKNHKYASGTYRIHGYAYTNNGLQFFLGGTSQKLNLTNYLRVSASKNGKKTLLLTNVSSSATSVKFPTWSNANGQDDVIWYTGKKIGPNQWSVEIDLSKHKSYGTFTTHAYVGKSCVNNINYSFSSKEFNSLKTGWRYENGYKFYYKNGVKLTDLDGILPRQSQYVIKINRITCTVTVYAKDGNNGYIIPVKVFACSVGLPSTPTPTGTFHTLAKYRWKVLMGPTYGQYATRIVDGILFHSVSGSTQSIYNVNPYSFNKLGSPASHGCVRLTVRDAKWIYDNCKLNTTVTIFDSKLAGPFPKPTLPKIPSSQNWDPTDPAVPK